ncbi:hypothetical protein LDENG_00148430 [Lucifuga dentata]|nr:hypothetical protein LDENG_00148430 [Lucifuga dentata]
MELFEDEAIVQISVKYNHYVASLVFTTNKAFTKFHSVFLENDSSKKVDRMLCVAILALLTASASALAKSQSQPQYTYSYSTAVGPGTGTSYTLTGQGRIDAVRVWENSDSFIRGIQFRYGYIWSEVVGFKAGPALEMELFEGQPSGRSFNMYAGDKEELRLISGRFTSSFLTSIGAHWAVLHQDSD